MAVPLQAGWHTASLSLSLGLGGALLALTLAGLAFAVHDLAARRFRGGAALSAGQTQVLIVLLVWTAATIAVLLPINIAWQRYNLPLLPVMCLWAAYGLVKIISPLMRAAVRPLRSRAA
jgi:hypothetical protein